MKDNPEGSTGEDADFSPEEIATVDKVWDDLYPQDRGSSRMGGQDVEKFRNHLKSKSSVEIDAIRQTHIDRHAKSPETLTQTDRYNHHRRLAIIDREKKSRGR